MATPPVGPMPTDTPPQPPPPHIHTPNSTQTTTLPPSPHTTPLPHTTADTGAVGTKYYHLMNTSLLVAAPLALFLSPSPLTFPVDLFLGVAFPLHAHVGFNYIISDYVPKVREGPFGRLLFVGKLEYD